MSPTVFRYKEYRFFFFSREESRIHVHVSCADGEAKFWLEPVIALANHYHLNLRQIREIQTIIKNHENEIKRAWQKHFKS